MNSLFITLMAGGWQIGIAVLAIIILFGGKKIPEMMKGLGTGIKEFKDATKEEEEETKNIEDTK